MHVLKYMWESKLELPDYAEYLSVRHYATTFVLYITYSYYY
jgi:hypothetical protein